MQRSLSRYSEENFDPSLRNLPRPTYAFCALHSRGASGIFG
jgi:hypothetical protein